MHAGNDKVSRLADLIFTLARHTAHIGVDPGSPMCIPDRFSHGR